MKKYLSFAILFASLLITSCNDIPSTSNSLDNSNPSNSSTSTTTNTTQNETTSNEEEIIISNNETEEFSDPIIGNNIKNLLNGFSMQGNITQRKYEPLYDDEGNILVNGYGDYVVDDTSTLLDTNLYYTNIAFNGPDDKAYYKYSYRLVSSGGTTIEVPSEGPYTYFEDENGNAYTESLTYSNELSKTYTSYYSDSVLGMTFGDNGFYNFFSILLDEDFAKNENYTAFDYYYINTNKMAIISNSLLYSLNSGAVAVVSSAYLRVDNGTFTSFSFELAPILSTDSSTGEVSLITNSVVFTFDSIGESTIKHKEVNQETEQSQILDEAFDKFANNQTYRMFVSDYNSTTSLEGEVTSQSDESTYYFTGSEIYVHDLIEQSDSEYVINRNYDYYLGTISRSNSGLYPYVYDESSNSYIAKENGFYIYADEEETTLLYSRFAGFYCGYYTYSDLLPIIAGISGTFFEYNEEENAYYATADGLNIASTCFLISKNPFVVSGSGAYQSFKLILDEENNLSQIEGTYSYTNYNSAAVVGRVRATYSRVGEVTLDSIIK